MPNSEMPTVRALLTARKVEFTIDDRVNLFDVGHTLYTDEEFRTVFDIAVYASILLERDQAHDYGSASFRIVDEQNEICAETAMVRLTVPARRHSGGDDAYIGAVLTSVLLRPGKHLVELLCERVRVASVPLYVVAGKRPQNVGCIRPD